MMPATLSIITATFPPKERGAALGIWAGVSAMALAIGPLVGGLITEHISWNWIFYINVPVGVLGLVAARLVIRESKDTSHEQRLDVPGLVTSGLALFALVFALIEANSYGWTSATILGLFALAAVSATAFVLLELRQRLPMFDMALFRNPTFVGANTVALLVSLAMFGVFFFISLYHAERARLQRRARRRSVPADDAADHPRRADRRQGLRPPRLAVADGGRDDARRLLAAALRAAAGRLVLLDAPAAMVIGGVGMALTMTPMTAAAMSSVPVDKAGVGSGMLNTFRQVGGSLGIAVMGAILAAGSSSALAGGATPVEAFVSGLHRALYTAAAIAFAAALTAAVTVRSHARATAPRAAAAGCARSSMSVRDPASGRPAPGGDRRRGLARVLRRQLYGLDDGRHRARGRGLRADHLPAFRLQARPLVCMPGRGMAAASGRRSRRSSRSSGPSRACSRSARPAGSCGSCAC